MPAAMPATATAALNNTAHAFLPTYATLLKTLGNCKSPSRRRVDCQSSIPTDLPRAGDATPATIPPIPGAASTYAPLGTLVAHGAASPVPAHFELDGAGLAAYAAEYAASAHHRRVQRALTTVPLADVAMDARFARPARGVTHRFPVQYEELPRDQRASGRCWLFASHNAIRYAAQRALGAHSERWSHDALSGGVDFSDVYLWFYHLLEGSNAFLATAIDTAGRRDDDADVYRMMESPVEEGGSWPDFTSLLAKYGTVPRTAMPETLASISSSKMTSLLATLLRAAAVAIRRAHAAGATAAALDELKGARLAEAYKLLAVHLGTPPQTFAWTIREASGVTRTWAALTPQRFATEFVGKWYRAERKVYLVHDPRHEPYLRMTSEGRARHAERQFTFVNVPADQMLQWTAASVLDGEAVWFGCAPTPRLRTRPHDPSPRPAHTPPPPAAGATYTRRATPTGWASSTCACTITRACSECPSP